MYMFSKILKNLRKEKGYLQSELAEKIGATNQNVSDWESGKSETSFEMLIKIAKVFEVTVGQLIGSEDY